MKKISFLIVTLIMSVGMVMAQGPRREKGKQPDPKERAEKMTERMANEFKLDDAQKGKLLELNLATTEKMKAEPRHRRPNKDKVGNKEDGKKVKGDKARDVKRKDASKDKPEVSKEAREQRMAKMKESRQAYDAKVKEIFTADQYKQYQAKQAERQQKMKDRKPRGERKAEA